MLEKEFTEFGVHKSIAPSIINCHGLYELPRASARGQRCYMYLALAKQLVKGESILAKAK